MVKIGKSLFLFILCLFAISIVSSWNFGDTTSSSSVTIATTTYTGNLTNFTELLDTPDAYGGEGGNCLKVNVGETGVEFSACGSITETDPLWSANYTTLNSTWSTTYNATYNTYNSTGLIKDWNVTQLIRDWNATSLIKDWNVTSLIINWSEVITSTNEVDPLWSANYTLFNDTWVSTYNATYDAYNSTGLIKDWNSTSLIQNWSKVITSTNEVDPMWTGNQTNYYNKTDIEEFGYYNESKINSTQFQETDGKLTLIMSYISTLFDLFFGDKTTDDLTEGSTNLYYDYGNASGSFQEEIGSDCSLGDFVKGVDDDGTLDCVTPSAVTDTNETARFENLTAVDCVAGSFIVGVQNNGTILCGTPTSITETDPKWSANLTAHNASWVSTYNATYNAYNSTGLIKDWNSSLLIRNWSLESTEPLWSANYTNLNATWSSVVNDSYVNYNNVSSLTVNKTDFWDDYNTTNSTHFEDVGGKLTIAITWLISFLDEWFSGKTTDDLTEGTTNLYDNKSWNETRANDIYSLKSEPLWSANLTAHNASWSSVVNTSYALATEPLWSANYTNLNATWSSVVNDSYRLLTNNTFYGNVNVSAGNLTIDTNSYISSQDKSGNITYNGTHWIWY